MKSSFLVSLSAFLFIGINFLSGQIQAPSMAQLQERYSEYKEQAILSKRFTIADLEPILHRHRQLSGIHLQLQGYSLQERPIYLATFGEGDIPVLLWSQMHGDESTATMALLDIFNFFNSDHPDDQSFISALKTRLTLYFVPMLNPDGAEEFERRNAAHIDLNRDALNLSSPESRLLKGLRDSLEPVFGFNLHDQSIYYRAGRDGQQVAMAFLAPAYDYDKNVNEVRLRSMQLIAHLQDSLQTLIPDRVAKYDDSFEPRAFGDNIQKWGTSTILIESGGYPDDPEKQFLRQMNFLALIKAFESIMMKSYETKSVEDYQQIPENERRMLSLIIEDLHIPIGKQKYLMDVGYLAFETEEDGQTHFPANIVDIGDLSTYSGLTMFSGANAEVIQGKWLPNRFQNLQELSNFDWPEKVRQGYLGFILEQKPDLKPGFSSPLVFRHPKDTMSALELNFAPGKNPTFILQSNETPDRWVVHNGKVYTEEEYITYVQQFLQLQQTP